MFCPAPGTREALSSALGGGRQRDATAAGLPLPWAPPLPPLLLPLQTRVRTHQWGVAVMELSSLSIPSVQAEGPTKAWASSLHSNRRPTLVSQTSGSEPAFPSHQAAAQHPPSAWMSSCSPLAVFIMPSLQHGHPQSQAPVWAGQLLPNT